MAQRSLMIAGLAAVLACGFPPPSTGHDWYTGRTNSIGVACCGSAECRPAAARYNQRTGFWETEVIADTWLPVPPDALAQIRCFFQPGEVRRDPLDGAQQPDVAHGPSRFLQSSIHLATWPPPRLITSAAPP